MKHDLRIIRQIRKKSKFRKIEPVKIFREKTFSSIRKKLKGRRESIIFFCFLILFDLLPPRPFQNSFTKNLNWKNFFFKFN